MRRFTVHLVTEVDFEDGDEASDKTVQNYQKHLKDTVRNAVQGLSLRTIKGARVETVVVEEVKESPPETEPPASSSAGSRPSHAHPARPADDARQHARERRPRGQRHLRSLRPRRPTSTSTPCPRP